MRSAVCHRVVAVEQLAGQKQTWAELLRLHPNKFGPLLAFRARRSTGVFLSVRPTAVAPVGQFACKLWYPENSQANRACKA